MKKVRLLLSIALLPLLCACYRGPLVKSRFFYGMASYNISYKIEDSASFTESYLAKQNGTRVHIFVGKGNYLEHYNNGTFNLYARRLNLCAYRGVNDDTHYAQKASTVNPRGGELKKQRKAFKEGREFRKMVWSNAQEETTYYFHHKNKFNPRSWRNVKFNQKHLLHHQLQYLPKFIEVKENGYTSLLTLDVCEKQGMHRVFFEEYWSIINIYKDLFQRDNHFFRVGHLQK
ncbi:MAG: hypothetical protein EAZ57_03775 [Cytophagales bacterium]|nr:MAG: hypothetical protein EAZ67_04790 [Cytophagales bacterium]TAF61330.1 MAG: hypothetical protein EAZ57_03775 [Cytophagales bacterium]